MQSDLPHTGAEAEPSDFLSKTPAQDTPSSSDELTDEEWAELERATDPDLPPDERRASRSRRRLGASGGQGRSRYHARPGHARPGHRGRAYRGR